MNIFKQTSGLACIALLSLSLMGCEEEAKEEVRTLRQVRSSIITENTGQHIRTFSGKLHAMQEAKLSFKVAGTIQDITVNIGDRVKTGDIVATLDSKPYELQAQQANAALVISKRQKPTASLPSAAWNLKTS